MYNIIHVEYLTRFYFIKKINTLNDPYYTDGVALRSERADSQAALSAYGILPGGKVIA